MMLHMAVICLLTGISFYVTPNVNYRKKRLQGATASLVMLIWKYLIITII